MVAQKILFLSLLFAFQTLFAMPLTEQFQKTGYLEIGNQKDGTETFDALYDYFDEMIAFLQINPVWAQKLHRAKERFIRSKDRDLYSTDFFGFYDESERAGRHQIAFYYSTHFHQFILSRHPEFNRIPQIVRFLEACFEIQKSYGNLFDEAAADLGLETIFSSNSGHPPILFKVIQYLPTYRATRPHYDGSLFSLFLDSTDNQSLLLSPYKHSLSASDFFVPGHNRNSIILIPGTLLTEFSIYPTPHIVAQSGGNRYATIAFAMRPNGPAQKMELSPLPNFNLGL